jgi:hypothetical protein
VSCRAIRIRLTSTSKVRSAEPGRLLLGKVEPARDASAPDSLVFNGTAGSFVTPVTQEEPRVGQVHEPEQEGGREGAGDE